MKIQYLLARCICSIAFVMICLSCNNSSETELYTLVIGNKSFEVEIANSPSERQHGLMFRRSLAMNRGMLFVFPDSQIRSFWMRNTYIDLSIAYIDANGVVIDILAMTALNEDPVRSSRPARYALEVNRGALDSIFPGDTVDFGFIPLNADN